MGVEAVTSLDVGKKILVEVIPNKYRGRNSGRMGLFSLETSRIQHLLWGRPGPSVLNVPIVPIQENSSDSQPPALPQTAATLHLQHQCAWGDHDPSHGLHSWVILLGCQHLHSLAAQTIMALLWGPSLHRSFLSWNHLATLTGTILCSGGPAPEDPQVPCHPCFYSWILPSPLSFMVPLSRTPYIPWPPMAVFQVSLLCTGPLLSQIIPKHLDYHLPLLSGRHRPLVPGPTPRFPLSPASGTP